MHEYQDTHILRWDEWNIYLCQSFLLYSAHDSVYKWHFSLWNRRGLWKFFPCPNTKGQHEELLIYHGMNVLDWWEMTPQLMEHDCWSKMSAEAAIFIILHLWNRLLMHWGKDSPMITIKVSIHSVICFLKKLISV